MLVKQYQYSLQWFGDEGSYCQLYFDSLIEAILKTGTFLRRLGGRVEILRNDDNRYPALRIDSKGNYSFFGRHPMAANRLP